MKYLIISKYYENLRKKKKIIIMKPWREITAYICLCRQNYSRVPWSFEKHDAKLYCILRTQIQPNRFLYSFAKQNFADFDLHHAMKWMLYILRNTKRADYKILRIKYFVESLNVGEREGNFIKTSRDWYLSKCQRIRIFISKMLRIRRYVCRIKPYVLNKWDNSLDSQIKFRIKPVV